MDDLLCVHIKGVKFLIALNIDYYLAWVNQEVAPEVIR